VAFATVAYYVVRWNEHLQYFEFGLGKVADVGSNQNSLQHHRTEK